MKPLSLPSAIFTYAFWQEGRLENSRNSSFDDTSNDTSLRSVCREGGRYRCPREKIQGIQLSADPLRAARRAKRRNSVSLIRYIMEGVRKRGRVMVFEIAKQSVGGTGKAIRTWAIAGYYGDVRDVSSIILIAKITGASTARPTNVPSPPYRATPPTLSAASI